jgi:voltage-gated potassium channel Kch
MTEPTRPQPSGGDALYDALYEKLNGPEAQAHRTAAQEDLRKGDVAAFAREYVEAKVAGAKYEVNAAVDEIKAIPKAIGHLISSIKGR